LRKCGLVRLYDDYLLDFLAFLKICFCFSLFYRSCQKKLIENFVRIYRVVWSEIYMIVGTVIGAIFSFNFFVIGLVFKFVIMVIGHTFGFAWKTIGWTMSLSYKMVRRSLKIVLIVSLLYAALELIFGD